MKTKRKKKRKTSRKSKQNTYKVTISLKYFSDELYEFFKKMKLNSKHNFIDFTSTKRGNKISFIFESRINHKYNSDPKWEDIHCQEQNLGTGLTIKTNCDVLKDGEWITGLPDSVRLYKVFVKDFRNLYDYIQAIKKNKVNKSNHSLLFNKLLEHQASLESHNRKINLINHNLDVKTLHFKFVES